ncbi:MAG: hypothetical protein AAF652_03780 [Cyanobacteria bacterium P01_C01_bin.72]
MNSSLPKPHRRQFVIGSASYLAQADWQSDRLSHNRWLSYSRDLRICRATDLDGVEWILLGMAIETTAEIEPKELISQLSTAEVSDRYYGWAGRWLLIGDSQIHLDANGLLGCFYGEKTPGDIWLSSSPVLLAQILALDSPDKRVLVYGKGMTWYTPPRSGFPQIRRLLASQTISFITGAISPRPLMPEIISKIDGDRHYSETITLIENALVTALRNLGKQQQPLYLGLTGGYDSRLMLAIAMKAGVNFTTFTRVAARMSGADRILPPKLAKQCGIPHTFLRQQPPPEQQQRRQLVRQHAGNNVSDGDAEPFVMGVRDKLKGISFGGHGFAIASGFHTLRQLPATFTVDQGAVQIAELFDEPADSSAVSGLQEWLSWIEQHPQPHLDWRDRFFLEQRQAGWLSSKEQVYDLTDLTRFPVLNASRTYSLLLSIPPAKRLGSLVQVALLERLAPQLCQYPFNPTNDKFNRWLRLAIATRDNPRSLYRKLSKLLGLRAKS